MAFSICAVLLFASPEVPSLAVLQKGQKIVQALAKTAIDIYIVLLAVITGSYNWQEFLYLPFKFVDADAIFIDSGCLLKNT